MSHFRISHIIKTILVLVIYFALCNYTLAQESTGISAGKVISGDKILKKIIDKEDFPYEKPLDPEYEMIPMNDSPKLINNDDTEDLYQLDPYLTTNQRDRIHKKSSVIKCCPCKAKERDINERTIYGGMVYTRRSPPISQESFIQSVRVPNKRRLLIPDSRRFSPNNRRYGLASGGQIIEHDMSDPVRVTQTKKLGRRTFFFDGDWSASKPSVSASLGSPGASTHILDTMSHLVGKGAGSVQVGASAGAASSRPKPSRSKKVRVSYGTPSVEGRVSSRPSLKVAKVIPSGKGKIAVKSPSKKARVSYQPSPGQFEFSFGRRAGDTESRIPARRTVYFNDLLGVQPAVSASAGSPALAQLLLDKVNSGREALKHLLGHGTSNVQVDTQKEVSYETPPTEERDSYQPPPAEERVPREPAPKEPIVSYPPPPTEEGVPREPAPKEPIVSYPPPPTEEGVPREPVPKEPVISNQPALIPNQPPLVEERVPNQPPSTEERVPNQSAPRDEIVPNPPAPTDEVVPNPPAPRDEIVVNQPAPIGESVPNSAAPRDEIVANQPAPIGESVPNPAAPRDERVSNQPLPAEGGISIPLPAVDGMSNPLPAEGRISNQPASIAVKGPYEPAPTEPKNQVADVAVQQDNVSVGATTN